MGKRTIHVWCETDGPSDNTVYDDGHTLGIHLGSHHARDFEEAAVAVLYGHRCFDEEKMTYYGYDLFEREPRYA